MATSTRERIIVNKGRANRGRRARTMSDKQIRIFGSQAQKAALSRRRSAKQSKGNRAKSSHRAASRKNAGEIIGYTFNSARHADNPARKKGTMAKTKKKRAHHKKAGYGRSNYRRNAGRQPAGLKRYWASHKHRKGSRRRGTSRGNPGHRRHRRNVGGMRNIGGIVTNTLFVIAGALGSKLLTQMVLGSNNVGLIGYAGNAVAGAALWFFTKMLMPHNQDAQKGIVSGTAVQIALRLINDYTPFGQYVAQLGMGDYQAQAFVTPQVLVDPYNSAEIAIPGAWRPQVAAPATTVTGASAGAGVGAYGGGSLYGGGSSLY